MAPIKGEGFATGPSGGPASAEVAQVAIRNRPEPSAGNAERRRTANDFFKDCLAQKEKETLNIQFTLLPGSIQIRLLCGTNSYFDGPAAAFVARKNRGPWAQPLAGAAINPVFSAARGGRAVD